MKAVLPLLTCICTVLLVSSAAGQTQAPAQPDRATPAGVTPPEGYVIGADDQLSVKIWGDERLSADVVVRSDGKISLPLLDDVQAAGFTPEQLKENIEKAVVDRELVQDPDATVIVTAIRSRKVFVIGEGVARAGAVPLNSAMNVLQVLAEAGGLLEFADKNNIVIMHADGTRSKFSFDQVVRGQNPRQNIMLKPGDTIVVN